jgi:hypothetical protein
VTASISVTRLRIRRIRYLPAFFFHFLGSQRQLRRSDGFLGGYTALGKGLVFWTVTAWRDANAMRAFRRTDAHLKAMPKLLKWCDEASVASLQDAGAVPLEPAEAARRLRLDGRISKVSNPSPAQARGELWPDGILPRRGSPIRLV